MIVDTLTHVWESPEQLGERAPTPGLRRRDQGADPLLHADPNQHFEALGPVDVSFVLGFRSELLGGHVPNRLVAEYCRTHPDRLIGFAGIDPMADSAFDDLDHAVGELKLRGVAISPSAQGFHPMDTRAVNFYSKVCERGMPLIVYQGPHPSPKARLEFAEPALLDEVLREFPDMKVILGRLGYPWIQQALILLAKHPNIFANLRGLLRGPWQTYNGLMLAHEVGVIDRLLFASDFPFTTPAASIETLYSLNQMVHGTNLPTIPREVLRGIVECDALGRLGLEQPQPAGQSSVPAPAPPEPESPEPEDDDEPDEDEREMTEELAKLRPADPEGGE